MKHNNEHKNPHEMTPEERSAEFERLLRKLSAADLQKVEDKILEMLPEEKRAEFLAQKAAEEAERTEEERGLRELADRMSGFSIGFTAFAVPKKGGEV